MTRLEDQLRAALQHEEPPAGFADRVLGLAAEQERRRGRSFWFQFRNMFAVRRLSWTAAVVTIAVVASGVGLRIQEQRRAEGEAAKRQVMLALRITGEKWQVAAKQIGGKTDTQTDQPHSDTHPDTENQE
jgi:hypothetical protein